MGICCTEKEKNKDLDQKNNNYIIAEIEIKDDDINKDILIINSYDEFHRHWDFKPFKFEESNEEEILKCEIRINNELKYSFKNCLTKVNCLFYNCEKLTKIDLSNLNTDKLTKMNAMFC